MTKPQKPKSHQITKPVVAVASVFPGRQWQQVLGRDASADGQFVFAVQSTKTYCRPSCPSRRPTRKNVRFFPTAAAAEEAGFSACLRCDPALVARRPDPQAAVIAVAAEYLTAHASERTRLTDLAAATGVGRLTLLRGFRRVLGVSPGEFARSQRVSRIKEGIRPAKDSIAAKRAPENNSDAGVRSATQGKTPRQMRAGGAGLLIRYATAASPLGRVLVAATDAGICAILFACTDAELLADLRQRFDRAQLVVARGNTGWLAEALGFVHSQTSERPLAATFPLDLHGTVFQQRVWRALQQIPRGQTRSYSAVARELGSPSAARAVAAACAANRVALAIACHRAIAADGSLSGYRWGLDRKKKILMAESAI
jgi:AraC family transcriptional regulator of adaptative response/methylated-DNA-[protein]-cysteine methyltransferase